jgi:ribonuclease T2
MVRFLRFALLASAAVNLLPAQFHLPGISGSSTAKPDAPAPKTKAAPAAGAAPGAASPAPSRQFDYYALGISWSDGRITVKGFAPMANVGPNPESCGTVRPAPKSAVSIVTSIMPGRIAIQQEWVKHGSCTGLAAPEYFNSMRFARSLVQIPVQLTSPDGDAAAETPKTIEAWFGSANPNFMPGAFRAAANGVEVCFDLQLKPLACPATGSK